MRRLKTSILVAVLAAAALAQECVTVGQQGGERHSGEAVQCNCNCKQDIACTMPPYPCPVCKRNKVRIYQMMSEGMSEAQILDTYVKENGESVLTVHPGASAMIGPYAALAGGLLLVLMIIRRYRRRGVAAPAGGPVDPAVLEQIEKDLAKLD